MSSWKKVSKINQKPHRERHQPEARKSLGLLEKKQDYKARADDYNNKKKILKGLKQKALNRNPDEFYFHMVNSRIIDDEHHENVSKKEFTEEQLKLIHTQDLRYIVMKRTQEQRKIERLQSQLHLIDHNNEVFNEHTYFINDSDNEKNSHEYLNEKLAADSDLLNYKSNILSLEKIRELKICEDDIKIAKELRKERDKLYKELAKRIDREYELALIQRKLELDRFLKQSQNMVHNYLKPNRISKGSVSKAPIYRWKYQRTH